MARLRTTPLAQLELEPPVSDNAALEGAAAVDADTDLGRIPVTRGTIFERLDAELRRQNHALLLAPMARTHPLDPPEFELYECELADGGKVWRVELIRRATELGVLDLKVETPTPYW